MLCAAEAVKPVAEGCQEVAKPVQPLGRQTCAKVPYMLKHLCWRAMEVEEQDKNAEINQKEQETSPAQPPFPVLVQRQGGDQEERDEKEEDGEAVQQTVDHDRGKRSALVNPFTMPQDDGADNFTKPHRQDHIGHQSNARCRHRIGESNFLQRFKEVLPAPGTN